MQFNIHNNVACFSLLYRWKQRPAECSVTVGDCTPGLCSMPQFLSVWETEHLTPHPKCFSFTASYYWIKRKQNRRLPCTFSLKILRREILSVFKLNRAVCSVACTLICPQQRADVETHVKKKHYIEIKTKLKSCIFNTQSSLWRCWLL